jgi:hypothetical protein
VDCRRRPGAGVHYDAPVLSRRTLALLTSLTLPLAACSAPAETPERPLPSSARPAFDGKAAIAASLSGIEAGVYSYTVTTTSEMIDGILHAPSRSQEVGRLSMLELTMPGEAGTWIVEVTDYGTARPAPAPPAAQVKELAPKDLRPLTDGDPVLA